jgi:Family of unknown function (DUF6328)
MKGPDRGSPEAGQERPGEGPLQRADRNMIELLQELRVAQTGVQILFVFLLSLSFTDRFAGLDEMQRWTYIVILLLAVITAGLLVAPAAAHRMTFGRGLKQETVQLGHKLFTARVRGRGDPARVVVRAPVAAPAPAAHRRRHGGSRPAGRGTHAGANLVPDVRPPGPATPRPP